MTTESQAFRVADWTVEPAAGRIRHGAQEIKLEPKVMDVLVYLAERPGTVVSREELEAAVWAGTVVGYDAVTGTMQKLRRAFGDDARRPRIIETLSKRGYRLVAPVTTLDEGAPEEAAQAAPAPPPPIAPRRLPRVLVSALAVTALIVAAVAWLRPWQAGDVNVPPQAERLSIIVLPFDNLGDDPHQQYFADGITDDLITDLTKISGLFVISRDSAFTYRGERPDVRKVAKEMDVRYVVHGSVRRAGDRVRINAQLTDTVTGKQLWAERYDGGTEDLFVLQDQINQQIVSALSVELSTAEHRRLALQDTDNVAAYEYFLRGEELFYRYARVSNMEARELFSQAIGLDPKFARAYAMLAWTHTFDFMNGWSDQPVQSLLQGEQLATRALELDPDLPLGYFVRGLVHRERGEYVKALVEAERAVELDANYANGHVLYATLLYYAGRPEEGLERMKQAIQLNPHHPFNYPFHLGQAYFVLGRYDEAIAEFKKGLQTNPASERLHVWLAASYARSGKVDEAKWEMDQVLTVNPQFSLERVSQAFPFKDPSDLERFVGGLRLAGVSR